jgi:hypothetical protein
MPDLEQYCSIAYTQPDSPVDGSVAGYVSCRGPFDPTVEVL